MATSSTGTCEHLPELERLNYCYGQMLGPKDFSDEQAYFRNKIALHNRCLHGYGVVCGLIVEPGKPPQTEKGNQYNKKPLHLQISCGFALDACGRELVARDKICVDFWECVDPNDREKILNSEQAYVTICYRQRKDQPVKLPLDISGECRGIGQQQDAYTRWIEEVCVKIVADPSPKQSCDPCCEPFCKPDDDACCIWLAKLILDGDYDQDTVKIANIDNSIRRPITLYDPVKISHINWIHGHRYTSNYTKWLLGSLGLLFRFTAPVRTETLDDGVVDLWKINEWPTDLDSDTQKKTGRRKQASGPGTVDSLPIELLYESGEHSDWLRIRMLEEDDCDIGTDDRIMITFRGDFVLDDCCQPVDANHLGGRVPMISPPEYEECRKRMTTKSHDITGSDYAYEKLATANVQAAAKDRKIDCHEKQWKHSNLASGNGVPGGTFESWFFTKPNK